MKRDADTDRVAAAQGLAKLREGLPFTLDWIAYEAQIKRAKYLAYVREGFTEQQALLLVQMGGS